MAKNGRYVLFVDDDAQIREVVESRLELDGISVVTAEDGEDALRRLEDGLYPDIIISDITMPNMDGFAFFRAVRDNEQWVSIPFVGLTEDEDGSLTRRARMLGMDDFLRKPFDSEQLLDTIAANADSAREVFRAHDSERSQPEYNRYEAAAPVFVEEVPTLPSRTAVGKPAAGPTLTAGAELKTYLKVLLLYKWVIITCTVVAVVFSIALTSQLTPMYSSITTLRVASASGGVIDWGASSLATRLGNTYARIVTSGPVLEEMRKRLGVEEAPQISVEVILETELIQITATHRDPYVARDGANILGQIMVERSLELYSGDTPSQRELLEGQLAQAKADLDTAVAAYEQALKAVQPGDLSAGSPEQLAPTPSGAQLDLLASQVSLRQGLYQDLLQRYESARVSEQLRANSITIVEPAYLSTSPSSPNKKLNLILGLFGGLVIGVGLAFLLETFKTSIRSVEEVQELTGLPILCQVPRRSQTLLTLLRRRQALAKQSLKPANIVPYHRLRVTLLSSNAISRGNTLMISSAEPGAGKSTTAAGLAVALAEAGNRVIVVDADFRRFGLSRIFGMNGKVGMGEVLTEKTALAAAVHNTLWPKLRILPAGQVFREATGKIPSDQIWQILKQLRQECDYVVIDSPALLSIADATILAKQADAVVMLAALRHTEPSDLRFALQHLAEVKAKTVGIVINRAPKSRKDTYYSRR